MQQKKHHWNQWDQKNCIYHISNTTPYIIASFYLSQWSQWCRPQAITLLVICFPEIFFFSLSVAAFASTESFELVPAPFLWKRNIHCSVYKDCFPYLARYVLWTRGSKWSSKGGSSYRHLFVSYVTFFSLSLFALQKKLRMYCQDYSGNLMLFVPCQLGDYCSHEEYFNIYSD